MPAVPSLGRVIAVARDPRCLFVHWRLTDSEFAESCAAHGVKGEGASVWLRVVQSGTTVLAEREITGEPEGRVYLEVTEAAGRRVRVELAMRAGEDGRLIPLERTRDVEMPREQMNETPGATWLTVAGYPEAQELGETPLHEHGGEMGPWEEVESLFELPCPVPAPWSREPEAAGEALTQELLKRWPHLSWQRDHDEAHLWRAVLTETGDNQPRENGPPTPSEVRVRFEGQRWLFRSHEGAAARVMLGPWQVAVGSRQASQAPSPQSDFVPLAQWQVHLAWQSAEHGGADMAAIYRTLFGEEGAKMLQHAQLDESPRGSGQDAGVWYPFAVTGDAPDGGPLQAMRFEPSEAWPFAELAQPARHAGASEELFIGASEQWLGASEQLFVTGRGHSVEVSGASEQLFAGASEQFFLGASEQLFFGAASEQLFFGAASEQFFSQQPSYLGASEQLFSEQPSYPGASEQLFAPSHNWMGAGTEAAQATEADEEAPAEDVPHSPGLPGQASPPPAAEEAPGTAEAQLPLAEREQRLYEDLRASGAAPDEAARRVLETYGAPSSNLAEPRATQERERESSLTEATKANEGEQTASAARAPAAPPDQTHSTPSARQAREGEEAAQLERQAHPRERPTATAAGSSTTPAGASEAKAQGASDVATQATAPAQSTQAATATAETAQAELPAEEAEMLTPSQRLRPAPTEPSSLRELPPAEIATAAGTVLLCVLAVIMSAMSTAWATVFVLLGLAGFGALLGVWPAKGGRAKGLRLASLFAVSLAVPLVVTLGYLAFPPLLSALLVVVFAACLVALLARIVLAGPS